MEEHRQHYEDTLNTTQGQKKQQATIEKFIQQIKKTLVDNDIHKSYFDASNYATRFDQYNTIYYKFSCAIKNFTDHGLMIQDTITDAFKQNLAFTQTDPLFTIVDDKTIRFTGDKASMDLELMDPKSINDFCPFQ